MGMDFKYNGSCSYPRFDKELTEIAHLFGIREAKWVEEHREEIKDNISYWFGFLSDSVETDKFLFPEGTPDVLKKFFSNPYDTFTNKETREIWDEFQKHPKIEDISRQIWNELRLCVGNLDCWEIL